MANSDLNAAKKNKFDEFYTLFNYVEEELSRYNEFFYDQTVLCNCDDPSQSNFVKYFMLKFKSLHLKRLIATCYKNSNPDIFSQNSSEKAVYMIYDGEQKGNLPDWDARKIYYFDCDGDFRSNECIELLKQATIVCTNPPFSLLQEYIQQLIAFDKKFVILGNPNALHYSDVFPYIKDNKMWIGYKPMGTDMYFNVPDHYKKRLVETNKEGSGYVIKDNEILGRAPAIWFTNLDIKKRHEEFIPYKKYNSVDYPQYENFDAIDVSKVSEIPCDYFGKMGVPDTFLDKYNPDQFELIGLGSGKLASSIGVKKNYRGRTDLALIKNGKHTCPYSRIIIRRKQTE